MPTHGSLTKAGKVRAQTPKVDSIPRKGRTPRKRNKMNYANRVMYTSNDRFRRRRRR